jgi:hypothetical protein
MPVAVLYGHTHLVRREKPFAGARIFALGTTTQWYAPNGNYLQVIDIQLDSAGGAPPALQLLPFKYGQSNGQNGFS